VQVRYKEAQMNRKVLAIGSVFLATALGTACGGKAKGAQAPTIQEEWLARVPRTELGQVEQARAARRMAQDELTRAEVDLKDAENGKKVQEAQLDAAKAETSAAKASVDAAKETGQATQVSHAQNLFDEKKLSEKVAKERVDLAQARIDAANTRRQLAQARVNTNDVRVSQAEYFTLRQQGDTRVKDIDPTKFEAALADRRAKESELENKLAQSEQKVTTYERQVRQSEQQLQARHPTVSPTG
jgi:multidrug resistance efflux pump